MKNSRLDGIIPRKSLKNVEVFSKRIFLTKKSHAILYKINLIFFLIYPIVGLFWSSKYGRAAYDLQYDDVSYALDAQQRLKTLENSGLVAFFNQFLDQPPHSPLSTTLALIGINLFGNNAIGFYSGNAILIWISIYFLYATILKFSKGRLESSSFTLLLLASPFSLIMLTDSRPDMANGFFLALICVQILAFKEFKTLSFKLLASITWFMALSSKLTTLPATLFLISVSICLRIIIEKETPRKEIFKQIVNIAFLALVFFIPLAILEFRPILEYIYSSFFTPSGTSASNMISGVGFWSALITYLEPGYQRLGGYFTPVMLLLTPMLALLKRGVSKNLLAIWFVAICSFVIIVVTRFRNPYFFSPVHAFSLILMILVLSTLYQSLKKNTTKRIFWAIYSIFLTISCLISPNFASRINDDSILTDKSVNIKLIQGLDEINPAANTVYVTVVSTSNSSTLNWKASTMHSSQKFTSDDYNLLPLNNFKNYEFVLIPNIFSTPFNRVIQSGENLYKIINQLSAPDSIYGVINNKYIKESGYFLFKRNHSSKEPWILETSTFKGIEGPYPLLGINEKFQWSASGQAKICLKSNTKKSYRFSGKFFLSSPDAVEISFGRSFKVIQQFEPMKFKRFSINGTPGEPISCVNVTPKSDQTSIALSTHYELNEL